MPHQEWELLEEVAGTLQAEILAGFLQAQGIPVFCSQEGVGRVVAVNVGRFGRVQILVPGDHLEHARQVLEQYYAGDFEGQEFVQGEPAPDDSSPEG